MRKMIKTLSLVMMIILMSACLLGCIGSNNGTENGNGVTENDDDNTGSGLSDMFSTAGKGTGNAKIDKVMKCLPPPEYPTLVFVDNMQAMQQYCGMGSDKKSAMEICVMDMDSVSYYGTCGAGTALIGDFDKEKLKNNPDADYYSVNYKGFGFLCSRSERYYAVIEKDKILYATDKKDIEKMIDVNKGKADLYYDVGCNEYLKRTINELDMSQVDILNAGVRNNKGAYASMATRLLADGGIESTVIYIYPPDAYPDEAYQAELEKMEEVNSNPDINGEMSVDQKGDMIITKNYAPPRQQ